MKYTFLYIILFAVVFTTHAQKIEVSASTDKTNYLIGEPIKLSLKLNRNKNVNVAWPFIVESIGAFEIIKNGKIDTTLTQEIAEEIQILEVAVYDSGNYVIPKIEFEYEGRNKQIKKISTKEIPIRIKTVAIDTTQFIKPIKPNLAVPMTWKERMPMLIALFLGLALLAALVFFVLRRTKSAQPKVVLPDLKPYQIAFNRLGDLSERKLWQNGKTKHYYSELTDIFRNYLEGRFGINALEMTSDEIGRAIKKKKEVTKGLYRNSMDLFEMADLVKFAKGYPGSRLNDEVFKNVETFVESTSVKSEEDKENLQKHISLNKTKEAQVLTTESETKPAQETTTSSNNYLKASLFERILAQIIDSLIVTIVLLILLGCIYFIVVKNEFPVNSLLSIYTFLIVLFLTFIPALVYEIICEQAMNGQTIGKRFRKIAVRNEDGSPVGLGRSIIRFVFKFFGLLFYGVGPAIAIYFSKKSQRIGDMVASTVVVYTHKRGTEENTAFEFKSRSRNRRNAGSNADTADGAGSENTSNTHLDKFLKKKQEKEAKKIEQERQAKFNKGFGSMFSSNKKNSNK